MSLAAALANATRTYPTRLDAIWAEAPDDTERRALLDIITDPTISHRAAAELITGEGYPVGKSAIAEARRVGWANHKEHS